jgi:hypothetical protein
MNASPSGTDMDNYLVIMTVDNDVDYAVYVRASDCESAFVEAAKLYPRSDVQPRVAHYCRKIVTKSAGHNNPAAPR